jgi:hypothetical protein
MNHFAPEKLAEFVRKTLPHEQHESMKQHLLSCSRCARLADLYRHIALAGAHEPSYMPPNQIVLTVKASFAIQKAAPRSVFELLFDSLAQPLPAGARNAATFGRQLLYRIGAVYIDMEVDRRSNSDHASLVGQMLDSSRPGHPMAGIPVVLLDRGRRVAHTSSNDNGEFHLEFDMKNDLKLSVSVDRQRVHLPITTASPKISNRSHGKKRKASAGVGGTLVPQ